MRSCRIKETVVRLAMSAGCGLILLTAPLPNSPAAAGSVTARKEEHSAHAAVRKTERAKPSERAFLQQAQDLIRRGQISPAVAALENGLTVYPRSAALHYLAARILAQQRNYAGARRHYERVVALAPGKTEGYFGLAQVAFAQRDY